MQPSTTRAGVYEMKMYDIFGRIEITEDHEKHDNIASVLCRPQGYISGVTFMAYQLTDSQNLLTWIDVVSCTGSEQNITECILENGISAHIGNESRHVGVVCFNETDEYGMFYFPV